MRLQNLLRGIIGTANAPAIAGQIAFDPAASYQNRAAYVQSKVENRFKRHFLSHPDPELHAILAVIDETITPDTAIEDILLTLDQAKHKIYGSLQKKTAPLAAKSLTIKILNLFLSKYQFLTRSSSLLSSPYGIIVDPMNACQLACPGCVHSNRSKELKLFDWGPGVLSESMFGDFMRRYGPYAIETEFCNYGEPLLNRNTPKLIRLAKAYLSRTMLSTNMGVKHFDAEAYVNSGLDYMTVAIDGATQSVYEKFRRKGDIEAVFNNVRSLIQTKKKMGKRSPLVSWQYLAFEHNEHEIDDAIKMARSLDFDQFVVASPFDVSPDDPSIRVSKQPPRTVVFRPDGSQGMLENWNPFPAELQAEPIEREFAARWQERLAGPSDAGNPDAHTCHYLYKNIVMDGAGRILPCCGAPQPHVDLVFGNAQSGADLFNSEKYRLARLSFANPEQYRVKQASTLTTAPYCANCEWSHKAQIDTEHLKNYFVVVGSDIFSPATVAMLSSW